MRRDSGRRERCRPAAMRVREMPPSVVLAKARTHYHQMQLWTVLAGQFDREITRYGCWLSPRRRREPTLSIVTLGRTPHRVVHQRLAERPDRAGDLVTA